MNLMLNYWMILILILSAMSLLIYLLSKKANMNNQKATPFECGFNPMSYSRLPFSIHFFVIAVIFLIFDIEIIMVMPMIITIKTTMIKFWVVNSITFTLILILGLFHEWNNGMIKWAS